MKTSVLRDSEQLSAGACKDCGIVRLTFGPVNIKMTTDVFESFLTGLTQVSEQLKTPHKPAPWLVAGQQEIVA